MNEYNVEVIENLSRVIEVQAESYDDALDKVQKMYDNEEIILDYNDCNDVEYKQYPANKIKNNINLLFDFNKDEERLYISSESSLGCDYKCRNIDDLKQSINNYIDNNIELINKDKQEMER